jgi:hypothetical protein
MRTQVEESGVKAGSLQTDDHYKLFRKIGGDASSTDGLTPLDLSQYFAARVHLSVSNQHSSF